MNELCVDDFCVDENCAVEFCMYNLRVDEFYEEDFCVD